MSYLSFVKNNLTQLPLCIGKPISHIPYRYRPGLSNVYKEREVEIDHLELTNVKQRKSFAFERLKSIAVYASQHIPFYTELYRANDVQPDKFRSFADLCNLPIITKEDLQSVALDERSCRTKGSSLVNTGGSTGKPLELYIEPTSVGHEWAHMHRIWGQLGFKQSHVRIVFGGRANIRNIVQYDSARHQINVDLYSGWQTIADRLLQVYTKYSPKYLHGYPSSIFDFVIWLDENCHPLLPVLRQNIDGMFLGSEYPSPALRADVEALLECRSVSWYGHTERAVLAYEKETAGVYYPFLSYGFAESPEKGRLICSSYYNWASPLIRYDTGDLIYPEVNEDLLTSFKISEGRVGDFILDRLGNKIFLTGLIFGRHHSLFDLAKHIQIHQADKGSALVLVVPRGTLSVEQAAASFDSSNVQVDFSFKIIPDAVRTKAGKVPLLVKEQ